jgi:hypothetical protein
MGTATSYPRFVNRLSRCAARSPRVYYSWLGAVLAVLVLASSPSRALAQIELSWTPSMIKGPASAPVTIVEFSDYQ